MATGPSYRVPYRRRREGRTNYRLRRALIRSHLPRLVVRPSLKHTNVQIIKAEVVGDKVMTAAHSRELIRSYGWQGNSGNIPAAYLTGLLCGFRALVADINIAVLDIGLHSTSKGARVFASLKGVIDAGVNVSHGGDILPDETRMCGDHIAQYGNQLLATPEEYQQMFSGYLSRGVRPEQLPEHFSLIKKKITSSFENQE